MSENNTTSIITKLFESSYSQPHNSKEITDSKTLIKHISTKRVPHVVSYSESNVKVYYHDEKIGFDQVTLFMDITKIDEDTLFKKTRELSNDKYPYVDLLETNDSESCVDLPLKTKKIAKLTISLSPYVFIKIEKNKLRKGNNTIRNDNINLTLRVEPPSNRRELGNISNYSVNELKQKIADIKEELKNDWGIYVRAFYFSNVEINTTILMQHNYNETIKALHFLFDDRYAIYAHNEGTEKTNLPCKRDCIHQISSCNKSLKLKLYDKAYEIANNDAVAQLRLNKNECLLRIEFTIPSNLINNYFASISVEKITDEELEDIFDSLVNRQILNVMSKFFAEKRKMRKKLALEIDTKLKPLPKMRKNKKYSQAEIAEYNYSCSEILHRTTGLIASFDNYRQNSPYFYGTQDLQYLISNSKTLKSIKDYCNEHLIKEYFDAHFEFSSNNYDILATFVDKLIHKEHRISSVPLLYQIK